MQHNGGITKMTINLNNQLFSIGNVEVLTISSSSNFQVGDNETMVLTSFEEDVAEGHQFGPFPMHITPSKFKNGYSIFKYHE